jgi:uncharacterized OsmC-like protein
MDATELRALQAPLKQRYRDSPDAARVTSRAEATLDPFAAIACTIPGWHDTVTAGLHPATGGDGAFACSADMLLQALVACAGVTLRAVATAMGIAVRSGKVIAEGVWDARGTLGVDRAAPVGLTEITLRFEIDAEADAAKLSRLIETTERYCVIYQTLKSPPRLGVAA